MKNKPQFSLRPYTFHKKMNKRISVIFDSIICAGIVLSIYQFLFNRSLWVDEAMLALNIIDKNFIELAKPLDYNQVAPIGFLFVEKFFVLIFGENEFALRLFPLISFLASIPLFYLITQKLTKNKIIAVMSTSIFSISLSLLKYSSEIKQYSIEVFFSLIILYSALNVQFDKRRWLYLYAIICAVGLYFSNVSIIMICTSSLYLLYLELYKNKSSHNMLRLLLFLMINFSFFYYMVIYKHPTEGDMRTYWHNYFLPLSPFSREFYIFLLQSAKDIYGSLLGFGPFWPVPLIISLGSIGFMLRYKNYKLIYFCFAPILLHLFISALKLYPFSGRLVLYLAPQIILIYAIGIYFIFKLIDTNIFKLRYAFLLPPVLIMFYPIYIKFPFEKEEIKKSLSYIEKNIKKDESVYVYYSSALAFDFYKKTEKININNPIIIGTEYYKKNDCQFDQLMNLTGKIWLLFSHINAKEEEYMVNLLLMGGADLVDTKRYTGSNVYLLNVE